MKAEKRPQSTPSTWCTGAFVELLLAARQAVEKELSGEMGSPPRGIVAVPGKRVPQLAEFGGYQALFSPWKTLFHGPHPPPRPLSGTVLMGEGPLLRPAPRPGTRGAPLLPVVRPMAIAASCGS